MNCCLSATVDKKQRTKIRFQDDFVTRLSYLAARPSLELKPLQVFFLFLLFFCSTDILTITRDGAMENEIFCCDDLINYAIVGSRLVSNRRAEIAACDTVSNETRMDTAIQRQGHPKLQLLLFLVASGIVQSFGNDIYEECEQEVQETQDCAVAEQVSNGCMFPTIGILTAISKPDGVRKTSSLLVHV